MALLEWLTALAVSLPPAWSDKDEPTETVGERSVRVAMIADAVYHETIPDKPAMAGVNLYGRQDMTGVSHKARAVALLVKWYWESIRFDRAVHIGATRGDNGTSVCLGMIRKGGWITAEAHASLVGEDYDATRRCARVSYIVLAHHRSRCVPKRSATRSAIASIYAGYGTGSSCNPKLKFAVARSKHWEQLMGFTPEQSSAMNTPADALSAPLVWLGL